MNKCLVLLVITVFALPLAIAPEDPFERIDGEVIANTEAIATNGRMHLCGTAWTIPQEVGDIVQTHEICSRVSTTNGNNYSCFSNGERLAWLEDESRAAIPSDSDEFRNIIEPHVSEEIAGWDAVLCSGGELQQAILKYSHPMRTPPVIRQGACALNQCYQPSIVSGEPGNCVQVTNTSVHGGYTCQSFDGEASWLSNVARLANFTANRYATQGSVMNCGEAPFTANRYGQQATFCQLLRSDNTIVMTVYLENEELSSTMSEALQEMERLGIAVPEGASYDEPTAIQALSEVDVYNPAYFSSRNGVLAFSASQVTRNPATRFMNWITSLFRNQGTADMTLVSTTATQYYVFVDSESSPRQHAVEYVQNDEGEFQRMIISSDREPIPYTDSAWTRLIQQR